MDSNSEEEEFERNEHTVKYKTKIQEFLSEVIDAEVLGYIDDYLAKNRRRE